MKKKVNGTKDKLIDVALDLFAQYGFKGTSIREIARLSGMTLPSIYYYFGSKNGLMQAILERSSSRFLASLHKVAERKDLDDLKRFKLLLRTHLDVLKTHRREWRIFFADEEHFSDEGKQMNNQFQSDVFNLYRRELQRLESAGYINYPDLSILALNILGSINWHLRWYKPSGRLSLEEIKDYAGSFVVNALGTNRPSKHR